jgi:hypothetical protein
MPKSMLIGCTMLLSLLAGRAYSANLVPATTVGDFIKYCASNKDECDNEITSVSVNDVANGPPFYICYPSTTKNEDINPTVLKWLSDHQGSLKMETDNGIYLALRTLYPCK